MLISDHQSRACLVVSAVLAAALLAAPAFAVDGVIELNQACAMVGCVAGDDPGLPIIIGSGSYRLTSDLLVSEVNGSAIQIASGEHTTVDLNGFEMIGPYECQAAPPTCPGGLGIAILASSVGGAERHITVRNGGIRNFGQGGVSVQSGTARIENLVVELIAQNGVVVPAGSIIRNNRLRLIGGIGIEIANSGNEGGLIEGNSIRVVGGEGVVARQSLLLNNQFRLTGGAILGGSGYGHNLFDFTPGDGVSMGDNVCSTTIC